MKYLFWIDMEMTGLDPQKHRILEVAVVVTDLKLQELDSYEAVVFQEPNELSLMDAWCTKHHGESGLTALVPKGKPESQVQEELRALFSRYEDSGKAVLAGNSIGHDKKFIDRWMPNLSSLLHYRMLDVSSFKIIFEGIYKTHFPKKKGHRAKDDIYESLGELRHYLNFIDQKGSCAGQLVEHRES